MTVVIGNRGFTGRHRLPERRRLDDGLGGDFRGNFHDRVLVRGILRSRGRDFLLEEGRGFVGGRGRRSTVGSRGCSWGVPLKVGVPLE